MGDWPGLIGAVIGFVIGWGQYKLVAGLVVAGLRRTDRSQTPAEYEDYERRILLLQAVILVLTLLVWPVMGYVIGRILFG
jgi:hypothetical protein